MIRRARNARKGSSAVYLGSTVPAQHGQLQGPISQRGQVRQGLRLRLWIYPDVYLQGSTGGHLRSAGVGSKCGRYLCLGRHGW